MQVRPLLPAPTKKELLLLFCFPAVNYACLPNIFAVILDIPIFSLVFSFNSVPIFTISTPPSKGKHRGLVVSPKYWPYIYYIL